MQDLLLALEAAPEDWTLRCSICQKLRENGKPGEAASVMSSAPEIPGDEESILFAATILGDVNPAIGIGLIDQFASLQELTSAIADLRAVLKQRSEGAESAEPTESNEVGDEERRLITVATGEQIKTFVIGPGAAVHAADRESVSSAKFGAVMIAALVHLVIAVLLMIWTVANPPVAPPQITVSSLAERSEEQIENQTLTLQQKKTASAATSQPVVSAIAFSDMSIPTTFEATGDLALMSIASTDMGFGMSMSGFGDVSNMSAIPAGMRSRCSMSQRMQRLRESGGLDRAETAVRNGLKFLATKQHPEKGHFGDHYTVGMTGLALLAFLGHCETPESPRFGDAVVNAAVFLMERGLNNDGKMTNGERGHHEAYEHAIATYALCELYSMTKESGREIPKLEAVLRKAVGIIVNEQTRDGGWPYLGRSKEDMSVSGWNIQALKAAHNTGRKFARVEAALDKAVERYLPKIQDLEGAFKYNPDHDKGRASLTGAALLGMQMWEATDNQTFKQGFAYLTDKTGNPSPGADYYAPYYNTQVFFLAEGPEWEHYNKIFQPRLLDAQNEDGSWLSPNNPRQDHQIMNTAWAILMLEVYYRYLPTTDKVDGLEATSNG
ncbi:MAG: hypothetical protein P1U81_16875 [Verrucomicrobiales bacterium]|nr:hypothetical protein [Verrucomicrobiales bacterium]